MKLSIRTLLALGLFAVAQAGFAATEPSITITRAGAPTGGTATITVNGVVPDPSEGITALQITFHLKSGEVMFPASATVAPGWDAPTMRTTPTDLSIVTTNEQNAFKGQISDGPIVSFQVVNKTTGFGGAELSIVPGDADPEYGCQILDSDFRILNMSPPDVVIVNGAVRHFGAPAMGSLAALSIGPPDTPIRDIAVGAGPSLHLLDASSNSLSDAHGWEGGKTLDGFISGRPAFSNLNGLPTLAIGTDAGTGYLFDVTTGTQEAVYHLGGPVQKCPAFIGLTGDGYWAVDTTGGPRLVHTRGSGIDAISLGSSATTVVSAPLAIVGTVVVGTSTSLRCFRLDGDTGIVTPTADAATGDVYSSSPVWVGGNNLLVGAASGKITLINAATGTAGASTNVGTAVSDGFYSASNGKAAFGGADGKVYFVAPDASGSTSVTFGTTAVSSPVTIKGVTYAADSAGNFGPVGSQIALGNASGTTGSVVGGAVAATGTTSGIDVVAVSTTDGDVVAAMLP